ncbi:MAG: hypothetical protein IPN03_15155 [Holophagales bacterium]|nr:hypothetical protein [Holophagales bacterium]
MRGKVTLVCPCGTVADAGTEKRPEYEDVSATTAPPAGAGPVLSETVHVAVVAPVRPLGQLIESVSGTTSMEVLFVTPP